MEVIIMATMFVRHKVHNYENWKRAYDEFAPVRKERGVTRASIHHDPNDPNTIIVTHQFTNMKAATDFVNSEELKSVMEKAGVSTTPEFWFGEDIEQTGY
jgi:quinol monooxygenase YgiN